MVQIQLTPEEQQLLIDILDQQLADLRFEIADTDKSDYKKMLKDQQQALRQLSEKIRSHKDMAARV